MSGAPEQPVRPRGGLLGVLPYLLDLIFPIVAFFVLKKLGASDFWALTAGGLLTLAVTVVNTIRRAKVDSIGLLVLLELALSVVLTFAVRDPRLILARPSLYIAVAALWILGKTFTGRPPTVDTSKPMAYKGDPRRLVAYEWAAEHSPAFLRIHRVVSSIWCVTFLVYAGLRLVIIYTVDDIGETVWLNEIPGVIGIAICLFAAARAGGRLEKIVDERVEQMFPVSKAAN